MNVLWTATINTMLQMLIQSLVYVSMKPIELE